ncbi:hypothetical protein HDR61_01705 [bacterium]|nr:hypothetical protein [bacterium]
MIYSHKIKLTLPNFKKIPNHALTHYVSDAYPTKIKAKKALSGFAPKPMIKRKKLNTKNTPDMTIEIVDIMRPTHNPKMPRDKVRNNIDKAAIARFFNNEAPKSREEQIQNWRMTVVAMLDKLDQIKAEYAAEIADAERELLIEFVESVRGPKAKVNMSRPAKKESDSYGSLFPFDDEEYYGAPVHYEDEDVFYLVPFDYEAEIAEYNLLHNEASSNNQMNDDTFVGINSIDATAEDKFERLFFENEVNAHKLDIFEKKMRRTNQERSMTKIHKGQLRRNMHRLVFDAFRSRQK